MSGYTQRNSYDSIAKKKKNFITQFKKWATNLNRHTSKEDITIIKRYMKRCSMSLSSRKCKIPSPLLGCLVSKKQKMRMWKNWNACILLVEILNGAAAMGNSKEVTQNIKKRTPYDPAIPLLG